jgi:hypothetical protein
LVEGLRDLLRFRRGLRTRGEHRGQRRVEAPSLVGRVWCRSVALGDSVPQIELALWRSGLVIALEEMRDLAHQAGETHPRRQGPAVPRPRPPPRRTPPVDRVELPHPRISLRQADIPGVLHPAKHTRTRRQTHYYQALSTRPEVATPISFTDRQRCTRASKYQTRPSRLRTCRSRGARDPEQLFKCCGFGDEE